MHIRRLVAWLMCLLTVNSLYAASGNVYLTTRYTYDVNGKKVGMTMLPGDGQSNATGINGKTVWQRDIFGNVSQKQLCIKGLSRTDIGSCSDYTVSESEEYSTNGNTDYYAGEQFMYDADNRLQSITSQPSDLYPDNNQEVHAYYPNGFLKSSTDLAGNTVYYEYDAAGMLIEHYIGEASNKTYRSISCYDTSNSALVPECSDVVASGLISEPYIGELVSVKEYWHNTLTDQINYTYTADGKPKETIYHAHLTAKDLNSRLQRTIAYRYNEYEQVAAFTDAKGKVTLYSYDDMGRMQQACLEGNEAGVCGEDKVSFYYVEPATGEGNNVSNGNAACVHYPSTDLAIHIGKLQCIEYSNGVQKQFVYDGYNRTSQMNLIDMSAQKVIRGLAYHYDPITSNLLMVENTSEIDTSIANNHINHYQYNLLGQLVRSSITDPNGKIQDEFNVSEFTYDSRGNLVSKTITKSLAKNANENITYHYNLRNQLVQIERTGAVSETIGLCSESSANNKCIAYEASGNMIQDGLGHEFGYNAINQLISYKDPAKQVSATYSYLANGLRRSKEVNTQQDAQTDTIYFYYDHSKYAQIVNEIQLDDKQQPLASTYYLMASGRDIRFYEDATSNNIDKSHLVQGHKSMIAALDSQKQIKETYNYEDYGQPLLLEEQQKKQDQTQNHQEATLPAYGLRHNAFQYSAEYVDAESGLNYLRARYYHPQLQLFPQRDSKALLNRYQYASSNPIMMYDPSGHMSGVLAGFLNLMVAMVDIVIGTAETMSGAGYYFGNAEFVSAGSEFFDALGYFGRKNVSDSEFAENIGLAHATAYGGLAVEMSAGFFARTFVKQIVKSTGGQVAGPASKYFQQIAAMVFELPASFAYSSDLYKGNFNKAFSGKTVENYMTGVMFAEGMAKPVLARAVGLDSTYSYDFGQHSNGSESFSWGNEFNKWRKMNFIDKENFFSMPARNSILSRNSAYTARRIAVSRIVYTARTIGQYSFGWASGSNKAISVSDMPPALQGVLIGGIVAATLGVPVFTSGLLFALNP